MNGARGSGEGTTVLLVLLVAGALALALFRDVLLRGEVLTPADLLLQHDPWRAVASEGLAPGNPSLADQVTQFLPWTLLARERGGLPLWNDRAAAGVPFLANLQSALLSPFEVFERWLPLRAALLATALAKVLLAATFTALLARRLGASRPAALLAALAFAFGGYQWLWLGHPHSAAAACLPLLLYLAERACGGERRSWWLLPAFSLAVAALLLAGHIETALHVALAVGGFVLLRLAGRGDAPPGTRLRAFGALALAALLGLLLAGVQLVPFVEYLYLSNAYAKRQGFQELWRRVPWESWPGWLALALLVALCWMAWKLLLAAQELREEQRAARGAARPPPELPPVAPGLSNPVVLALLLVVLVTQAFATAELLGLSPTFRLMLHPDAWGHPVPELGLPYAGARAYSNVNGAYAGLLCLPLALFAAVCAPRPHAGVRTFGLLWVAAFLVAYEAPLVAPLANRLPLLDLSLNSRLSLVVGFATAMLAAFGLDALARGVRRHAPSAFWLLAGALLVGVVGSAFVSAPAEWAAMLTGERAVAVSVASAPAAGRAPALSGPVGGVVPITLPASPSEPLRVQGWALDTSGLPEVSIELEQSGRSARALVQPGSFVPLAQLESHEALVLAAELAGHPQAERCGFVADLDVSDFHGGLVRLRVALHGADDRVALIEERQVKLLPDYPVRARWWALGGLSLLLVAWGLWRPNATVAFAAVGLLAVDLFCFADGFNPSAPPEHVFPATPLTDALRAADDPGRVWAIGEDVLMPNTAGVYGLSDVRSYDALEIDRFELFLELLRPLPDRAARPGETIDLAHPLAALLDIGYVLAPLDWTPPPGAAFARVLDDGHAALWRNEGPRARAFLAPRAWSIDEYLAAAPSRASKVGVGLALANEYREMRHWQSEIVLEGAAPRMEARGPSPGGTTSSPRPGAAVRELERAPERIALACESDAPAWLVVTDAFFPGWKATVDGREAPIEPAFFAFRAVKVPAGSSTVEMSYDAESLALGTVATAAAAFAMIVQVLVLLARRRRRVLGNIR